MGNCCSDDKVVNTTTTSLDKLADNNNAVANRDTILAVAAQKAAEEEKQKKEQQQEQERCINQEPPPQVVTIIGGNNSKNAEQRPNHHTHRHDDPQQQQQPTEKVKPKKFNTGPSPLIEPIDNFVKNILQAHPKFAPLEEPYFKDATDFLQNVVNALHRSRLEGVNASKDEELAVNDCIETFKQSLLYPFMNASSAFRATLRKIAKANNKNHQGGIAGFSFFSVIKSNAPDSDGQQRTAVAVGDEEILRKSAISKLKSLTKVSEEINRANYGNYNKPIEDEFEDIDEAVEHEYFDKGVSAAGEFLEKLPFVGQFIQPLGAIVSYAYEQVKLKHREYQCALDLLKKVYRAMAILRQLDDIAELLEDGENDDPKIAQDFDEVASRINKVELIIAKCLNTAMPFDSEHQELSIFQEAKNFIKAGEDVPLLENLDENLRVALKDLEDFVRNMATQAQLKRIQRIDRFLTQTVATLPEPQQKQVMRSFQRVLQRRYQAANYFTAVVAPDTSFTLRSVYVPVRATIMRGGGGGGGSGDGDAGLAAAAAAGAGDGEDATAAAAVTPLDILQHSAFASPDSKYPSVMLLSGPPGIGRSWFLKRMSSEQTKIEVSSCMSMKKKHRRQRGGGGGGGHHHHHHSRQQHHRDPAAAAAATSNEPVVEGEGTLPQQRPQDAAAQALREAAERNFAPPHPCASSSSPAAGDASPSSALSPQQRAQTASNNASFGNSSFNKSTTSCPTPPSNTSFSARQQQQQHVLQEWPTLFIYIDLDSSDMRNLSDNIDSVSTLLDVALKGLKMKDVAGSDGGSNKSPNVLANTKTLVDDIKDLIVDKRIPVVWLVDGYELVAGSSQVIESFFATFATPAGRKNSMMDSRNENFKPALCRDCDIVITATRPESLKKLVGKSPSSFREDFNSVVYNLQHWEKQQVFEFASKFFMSVQKERDLKLQAAMTLLRHKKQLKTIQARFSEKELPGLARLVESLQQVCDQKSLLRVATTSPFLTKSRAAILKAIDVVIADDQIDSVTPRFANLLCQCCIKGDDDDDDDDDDAFEHDNKNKNNNAHDSDQQQQQQQPSSPLRAQSDSMTNSSFASQQQQQQYCYRARGRSTLELLEIFIDLSYSEARLRFERAQKQSNNQNAGLIVVGTAPPGKVTNKEIVDAGLQALYLHQRPNEGRRFRAAESAVWATNFEKVGLVGRVKQQQQQQQQKQNQNNNNNLVLFPDRPEFVELLAQLALLKDPRKLSELDWTQRNEQMWRTVCSSVFKHNLIRNISLSSEELSGLAQQTRDVVVSKYKSRVTFLIRLLKAEAEERVELHQLAVKEAQLEFKKKNPNDDLPADLANPPPLPSVAELTREFVQSKDRWVTAETWNSRDKKTRVRESFRDITVVDLFCDLVDLVYNNQLILNSNNNNNNNNCAMIEDGGGGDLQQAQEMMLRTLQTECQAMFERENPGGEIPSLVVLLWMIGSLGRLKSLNLLEVVYKAALLAENTAAGGGGGPLDLANYKWTSRPASASLTDNTLVKNGSSYCLWNLALIDLYENSSEENRDEDQQAIAVQKWLEAKGATLSFLDAIQHSRAKSNAVEKVFQTDHGRKEAKDFFASGLKLCVDKQSGPLCACLLAHANHMNATPQSFGQAIQVVGQKLCASSPSSPQQRNNKKFEWLREIDLSGHSDWFLEDIVLIAANLRSVSELKKLRLANLQIDNAGMMALVSELFAPQRAEDVKQYLGAAAAAGSAFGAGGEILPASPLSASSPTTNGGSPSSSPAASSPFGSGSGDGAASPASASTTGTASPPFSPGAASDQDLFNSLTLSNSQTMSAATTQSFAFNEELADSDASVMISILSSPRGKYDDTGDFPLPKLELLDLSGNIFGIGGFFVLASAIANRDNNNNDDANNKNNQQQQQQQRQREPNQNLIVVLKNVDRHMGGQTPAEQENEPPLYETVRAACRSNEGKIPKKTLKKFVTNLYNECDTFDVNSDVAPRMIGDHLVHLQKEIQKEQRKRARSETFLNQHKHHQHHHRSDRQKQLEKDKKKLEGRLHSQYLLTHKATPNCYAESVINVMRKFATLRKLNLRNTFIGASRLFSFFRSEKARVAKLQEISLDDCDLGIEAEALLKLFVHCVDPAEDYVIEEEEKEKKPTLEITVSSPAAASQNSTTSQQQQPQQKKEQPKAEEEKTTADSLPGLLENSSSAFYRQGVDATVDDICARLGGSLVPVDQGELTSDTPVKSKNSKTGTTAPAPAAPAPAAAAATAKAPAPAVTTAPPPPPPTAAAPQKQPQEAPQQMQTQAQQQQQQQDKLQYEIKEVSTFRNQRKYPPFGKWSDKLLYTDRSQWSDITGKQEQPKSFFDNDKSYQWVDDWELVIDPSTTDNDGWAYAIDFPAEYHNNNALVRCVRRQEWVRKYRVRRKIVVQQQNNNNSTPQQNNATLALAAAATSASSSPGNNRSNNNTVGSGGANARYEVKEQITFENQRYFPLPFFYGWKDQLLPTDRPSWSDATGKKEQRREAFPARDWLDDWEIAHIPNRTDPEGWEYARDFPVTYYNKYFVGACVRRRIWIRRYKDLVTEKPAFLTRPRSKTSKSIRWGLTRLSLANNKMPSAAVPYIHRILEVSCNTLTHLDLSNNSDLGQALVESLKAVVGSLNNLYLLYINDNGISNHNDLINIISRAGNGVAHIGVRGNGAVIQTASDAGPWLEYLKRRKDALEEDAYRYGLYCLDLTNNDVYDAVRRDMVDVFPDESALLIDKVVEEKKLF